MKVLFLLALLLLVLSFTIKPASKNKGNFDVKSPPENREKHSEMLDEEQYWKIIANSLENTTSEYEQETYLIAEVSKLSTQEMVGFQLRTHKLLANSYSAELWCAAYIMNGGCSDDGFEYFRNWVISLGKAAYYAAIDNPDTLATQISKDKFEYEFETFSYVAIEAFKRKTGGDLYELIDFEAFHQQEGHYPAITFNWEEDKPESMQKICPQLFDRLWR